MIFATIVYQQLSWLVPVVVLTLLFVATLVWAYFRAAAGGVTRTICFLAKLAGFGLLAYCLLEPMSSKTQPRQGANLMLLVTDNSQSMSITDADEESSRGDQLKQQLTAKANWQTRLEQDFDVRRFTFDTRIKRVPDFETLSFDGRGSSIASTLDTLKKRFENRPVAGVILFTDGNSTDSLADSLTDNSLDLDGLPPIYPVAIGSDKVANDISISNVTVKQSNFEAAPVTLNALVQVNASAEAQSDGPQKIVAELLDNTGATIQQQTFEIRPSDESKNIRFQFQPLNPGVDSYRLVVAAEKEFDAVKQAAINSKTGDEKQIGAGETDEPTLANNHQQFVVNRRRGPFRVLYVSGRPNWEYKYLQRAISEDEEVNLIGLVRIAKKEPKFDFRSRMGESTNPLFRGFGEDNETSEQYDEPVLIRLGNFEEGELSDGFPKTEEELFPYHAVILDDVEAGFFRQDQMQLLKTFVSRRGGGLMMLGGTESFHAGGYRRTPIADLLPVYLTESRRSTNSIPFAATSDQNSNLNSNRSRFDLARDGWLTPWIRLRKTEDEERVRLKEMAKFATVNDVGRIKPGAEILATVSDATGKETPAIAVQSFGRGRTVAMSVGDFWRWGMARETTSPRDLEPAWRQTVRWLISDVPDRVNCVLESGRDSADSVTELKTTVLNEQFLPQDNAEVEIEVTRPDGSNIRLTAQSSGSEAGVYSAEFASAETGGYRAKVIAKSADGTEIGETETGWVYEPAQIEFASMRTNREFLQRLASATGGEVIESDGLDSFVSTFNDREIPIMEKKISPLWHRWYFFMIAIGLLMFEWGLRRVKGLP